VVDRVKNFLTFSLIAVQNLVVVSHTVYMHVGGPKQFGGRWDPDPWDGGVSNRLETQTRCPHMCHLTKFLRQRSIRLGVGMCPEKLYGC